MTDNIFFFFNDTATTEIYTLSLHDALPISPPFYASAVYLRQTSGILVVYRRVKRPSGGRYEDHQELPRNHSRAERVVHRRSLDRKSTRLNSSHANISYAVFCLKKKKSCVLC